MEISVQAACVQCATQNKLRLIPSIEYTTCSDSNSCCNIHQRRSERIKEKRDLLSNDQIDGTQQSIAEHMKRLA